MWGTKKNQPQSLWRWTQWGYQNRGNAQGNNIARPWAAGSLGY